MQVQGHYIIKSRQGTRHFKVKSINGDNTTVIYANGFEMELPTILLEALEEGGAIQPRLVAVK